MLGGRFRKFSTMRQRSTRGPASSISTDKLASSACSAIRQPTTPVPTMTTSALVSLAIWTTPLLSRAPDSKFGHVAQWGSFSRPSVRPGDRIGGNGHDVPRRLVHQRILIGEHLGIGSVGYDAQIPGGNDRERSLLERTIRHVGEEVLDNACVLFACDRKKPVNLLRQRRIQRGHRSAHALPDLLVQTVGNQQ